MTDILKNIMAIETAKAVDAEVNKILEEIAGVDVEEYRTLYNACATAPSLGNYEAMKRFLSEHKITLLRTPAKHDPGTWSLMLDTSIFVDNIKYAEVAYVRGKGVAVTKEPK